MNKNLWPTLKKFLIIALPIFVVFLIGDLVSKHMLDSSMQVGDSATFLPGFIDIVIVHNEGSAWGMFQGMDIFIVILTFLFIIALFWFTFAEKITNPLFHIAFGFILAGGVGNLVDRLAFGYVRDFLHFEFWPSFPVFNIADICLTVGVIIFIIYVLYSLIKNNKKKSKIEEKIE